MVTNTLNGGSRKRVLVIGAGDSQLPLVERAAQTCDVVLAAPAISDDFKPHICESVLCDVRDFDAIMGFLEQREPIQGVLTDGTDIPVLTVARVAEALGLPGIGVDAARLFTDKALMRDKMEELGIATIPHVTVHSLEEATEAFGRFPGEVIIKPVDSQGSRGVQVCGSLDELVRKYPEAARWSSEAARGAVLLEHYIRGGREFVVEGMAVGRRFWNLCIGDTLYFDVDDSLSAKERTFPTVADDALRARVLDLNARIVTGFGLAQGITHSEFIMEGESIYLIETAARGGGAFISSDLIPLSCGLDTANFLLGLATGAITRVSDVLPLLGVRDERELETIPWNPRQHCCYVAFYIPAGEVMRVEGADTVRALPYVHRHQIDGLESLVGQTMTSKNTDKTSRRLVVISAGSRAELEARMRFVRETIRMEIRTPAGDNAGLIWE